MTLYRFCVLLLTVGTMSVLYIVMSSSTGKHLMRVLTIRHMTNKQRTLSI